MIALFSMIQVIEMLRASQYMLEYCEYIDTLLQDQFREVLRTDVINPVLNKLFGTKLSQQLRNTYFHVETIRKQCAESQKSGVGHGFCSYEFIGLEIMAYGVVGKITNFKEHPLVSFFDPTARWKLSPNGDRFDVSRF